MKPEQATTNIPEKDPQGGWQGVAWGSGLFLGPSEHVLTNCYSAIKSFGREETIGW